MGAVESNDLSDYKYLQCPNSMSCVNNILNSTIQCYYVKVARIREHNKLTGNSNRTNWLVLKERKKEAPKPPSREGKKSEAQQLIRLEFQHPKSLSHKSEEQK